MITEQQARNLAVRYQAYMEAVATIGTIDADWAGVRVWGNALRDTENETGVQLTKPENRDGLIESADRNLAKVAA